MEAAVVAATLAAAAVAAAAAAARALHDMFTHGVQIVHANLVIREQIGEIIKNNHDRWLVISKIFEISVLRKSGNNDSMTRSLAYHNMPSLLRRIYLDTYRIWIRPRYPRLSKFSVQRWRSVHKTLLVRQYAVKVR
jgi:hypothetical protein